MSLHLYRPYNLKGVLTFARPDNINTISTMFFYVGDNADDNKNAHANLVTKLVSGYEPNREINIVINECHVEHETFSGYVISCFRTPFICKNLVFSNYFTTNLALLIVEYKKEIQVWHVLSARKKKELASIKKIKSMNVIDPKSGQEKQIKKEVFSLTGNVPQHFLTFLINPVNNQKELDILTHYYPVQVNETNVTISCV
ncbi:EP23 [Adoxophyes orana nucleopolyhedrovirus]|uniref:EP23 n=1 Tax=Adoxophyes orana nucleopolyhedrovirus TaxID=542343 RepID=UPI0001829BE4|nr:EP23 [Adoxophyes orana nucleopolyhedrovirus]ACF05311.1 EP23 [Adoxophyes orana nucleopolyhedrovirus]